MSRIKGWRKEKVLKAPDVSWISSNKKTFVAVESDKYSHWLLNIASTGFMGSRDERKLFKTKQSALKFARSWMRKHPKG